MKHFATTRSLEVLALQASPFLGIFLGGFNFQEGSVVQLGLLLLGSLALTIHVFVFNDWAGHGSDSLDPRRAMFVFTQKGISRHQVACVATALLIIANVCFACIGGTAVLLANAIAGLSVLYSYSSGFGKNTPVLASVNHLIGGALHFLLGYTLFHPIDVRGVVISLFFGLVFAGGHLNQEVRDYEGDCLSGIRTSAVVFGCKRTFVVSVLIFSAAYVMLAGLSHFGFVPGLLFLSMFLWALHVAWSLQAHRRGLGFETALWMQRRYRLLFGVVGLVMLVK